MGKYLIRRLVNYVVLVFIATSLAYLLAAVSLNPRSHFFGRNPPIPVSTQDNILNRYNINDKTPVLERYGTWLNDLAHGNLGRDFDGGYVGANLSRRLWVSGQLLLIGTILGGLVGIATGAWAAVRHKKPTDYALTQGAFFILSCPVFVIAILLQVGATRLNNAVGSRLISFAGQSNPALKGGFFTHLGDRLDHLILPTITLTLAGASFLMLYQRAAMLDVLGSDYVRTARAKGLRRRTALIKHALRTALIPSMTIFTYSFATIFVGAIFTETIFGWHGMGEWFIQTIQGQDTNAVAAITAVTAVLILFASFLQDVVVALLDPRIRVA